MLLTLKPKAGNSQLIKNRKHLWMCNGKGGKQICEGSQMWTVFWSCVVRMGPVCPQDILENIPTNKFKVLVADAGCPLSFQLVVLPRLPLHVVHSLLSTQSIRVDIKEVPPNNLTQQQTTLKSFPYFFSTNIGLFKYINAWFQTAFHFVSQRNTRRNLGCHFFSLCGKIGYISLEKCFIVYYKWLLPVTWK